jgi:hypothetical protein
VVRRVVSEVAREAGGDRVLASEPAEEHNVLTAQTASAGLVRSGSLSSVAAASSSASSSSSSLSFQSPGPLTKRLSLSRSKPAASSSSLSASAGPPLLGYCRPVFHPSPSGRVDNAIHNAISIATYCTSLGVYCAVVWPDAATYIVLKVTSGPGPGPGAARQITPCPSSAAGGRAVCRSLPLCADAAGGQGPVRAVRLGGRRLRGLGDLPAAGVRC